MYLFSGGRLYTRNLLFKFPFQSWLWFPMLCMSEHVQTKHTSSWCASSSFRFPWYPGILPRTTRSEESRNFGPGLVFLFKEAEIWGSWVWKWLPFLLSGQVTVSFFWGGVRLPTKYKLSNYLQFQFKRFLACVNQSMAAWRLCSSVTYLKNNGCFLLITRKNIYMSFLWEWQWVLSRRNENKPFVTLLLLQVWCTDGCRLPSLVE